MNQTISTYENQPPKLPGKLQFTYALGQFGWSLINGLITFWLVWFYNPPEGDVGALDILFIPQERFLGFLTIIGIITMLGRLVDAVTDPLIASMSDRSNHPKGRRISFMAKGTIPYGILTLCVFYSPINEISYINVIWLGVTLIVSYIFFTLYVTPYFALVSELGHTPKEKLNLSTYISATWFFGFAASSFAANVWRMFEAGGMEKLAAIRLTMAIFIAIGVIFMLIPVFTINEKKYSRSNPSTDGAIDALLATFKNREFRVFVVSDLIYWFAITIFSTGTVYYVTVLVGLPETWTATVTSLAGILSFFFYPVVNLVAKKIGKKIMISAAFCMYAIVFLYAGFLGKLPFGQEMQLYVFILLTGIPMAILGILPNAVVADVAEYEAKVTNVNREAMFFGARTFMSKLGQMFGMLIFGGLITFGKSAENDIGVRMTAYVAAATCLAAMFIFLLYNEKKILSIFSNNEK